MTALLSPGSGALDSVAPRTSFLLFLVSFGLLSVALVRTGAAVGVAAEVGVAVVFPGTPAGWVAAFASAVIVGEFVAGAVEEVAAESGVVGGI